MLIKINDDVSHYSDRVLKLFTDARKPKFFIMKYICVVYGVCNAGYLLREFMSYCFLARDNIVSCQIRSFLLWVAMPQKQNPQN